MSLMSITLSVVGCTKCGLVDGYPMQALNEVKLSLDQSILENLPDHILGVVTAVATGQLSHPETRAIVDGTYYTIEYESEDLLGVIPHLEHCFVTDIECQTCCDINKRFIDENAEKISQDRVRLDALEKCAFLLQVEISLIKPVCLPQEEMVIVSDTVDVTFINTEGQSQVMQIPWAPSPEIPGPFVITIQNAVSLVGVVFSDNTDVSEGYELEAEGALTCPDYFIGVPDPTYVLDPSEFTVDADSGAYPVGSFFSSEEFLGLKIGTLIVANHNSNLPVTSEGTTSGTWVWVKAGTELDPKFELLSWPNQIFDHPLTPVGTVTALDGFKQRRLLNSPPTGTVARFIPVTDGANGVLWEKVPEFAYFETPVLMGERQVTLPTPAGYTTGHLRTAVPVQTAGSEFRDIRAAMIDIRGADAIVHLSSAPVTDGEISIRSMFSK